ncbi:TetR/AcrR family transcriptional regulator [Photobacterium swingsii]|uniref:TetR/AcrR family transcriptional regulator n=1 Tax=Photobacterium swingsii TaxID=680026 RepID=A0A0J8V823_9GAMM|nr:TetR/AcrR family transcriptional regulator [Photobacterium swingsii]KMV28805.1 transcriptional regulator [Photobacterium swingsii]PSW24569.1 TetR/AcrR family transcriptional regulator [Photobacterium swingsii]
MKRESTEKRLERIHTAITNLVAHRDVNAISIYDVAKEASIAASTVYHHYPNIEALIYGLMEGIFADFTHVLDEAIKPEEIRHWSDINRMIEQGFVDYYRGNPLVQRILLGQHTYTSIRHADAQNDLLLAEHVEAIYRRYFVLPELPNDVNIFAIALQVADKVYSMNYRENGDIPPEMAREAKILTEAYLGTYLPRNLPRIKADPTLN